MMFAGDDYFPAAHLCLAAIRLRGVYRACEGRVIIETGQTQATIGKAGVVGNKG